MCSENSYEQQNAERQQCLETILQSPSSKRLIVAGPGTGKTYTFAKILEQSEGENNLVMTFINRLIEDMKIDLEAYATVKTFHAFCKQILHDQNIHLEVKPYLTKLIEKDASLLGRTLRDFNSKFRNLEEGSSEITFYLSRGDYYGVAGFDDFVYRLYKLFQDDPSVIPSFDNILIDEFQDFNVLEVAFIEELEQKGKILIVGDDDQAVYDRRKSSPDYLRNLYREERFDKFELPYCSRCTEAIVNATNAIVTRARSQGSFRNRIPKRYECFLPAKSEDNSNYPRIITARCTLRNVVPKYVKHEISRIAQEDVIESNRKSYITVLIVGPRHYLSEVENQLKEDYPQISYSPSSESNYAILDGYEELIRDREANLGWRIIVEKFCDEEKQIEVLQRTEEGNQIHSFLEQDFKERHLRIVDIMEAIKNGEELSPDDKAEVVLVVGEDTEEIIDYFTPREKDEIEPEIPELDETRPKIVLTSFVGCKGLQAGHVFIIGANNGNIPRDKNNIKEVEVSQFIVALTRTRKQCHVVSTKWLIAPVDTRTGEYENPDEKSEFISWIPSTLIEDRGELAARNF